MSRILLVDDSPHAQRMGERILSEEGYEVVTVSNADSALIRLDDVDPDVVLADTVMPGRTGYEICQYLKMSPRHRHVRVILTAGVLEPFDDAHLHRVEADGTLKKPFEASALLAAVKPLAEAAVAARKDSLGLGIKSSAAIDPKAAAALAPFVAVVDAEQVRAAVTVALDASMGAMVEEISRRVLAALTTRKSAEPAPAQAFHTAAAGAVPKPAPAAQSEPLQPAPPQVPSASRTEIVRRVNPLRLRAGSILGLDLNRPDALSPEPESGPSPSSPSPSSDDTPARPQRTHIPGLSATTRRQLIGEPAPISEPETPAAAPQSPADDSRPPL